MKRIIAITLAVLMAAMTFIFAGCGDKKTATDDKDSATASSDLAYVQSKGKLVVGITDFEPMDYKAKGSDEWIGFDADMAKAFAKSIGVEVEFVEIDWDNKVMEINNKSIDCVWNGMTLDDEVTSAMSCTKAYCNNAQVVVVNKDVASKYNSVEACKDLTFAVEAGSTGEKTATANGLKATPVKDQATALTEVSSGTCDAAIIDKLMAAAMVGEGTANAKLAYTIDLNSEKYGVGFRQGSDLTAKLNEFFKTSMADGSMEKIAEKYGVQASLIK